MPAPIRIIQSSGYNYSHLTTPQEFAGSISDTLIILKVGYVWNGVQTPPHENNWVTT